MIGVRTRLMLKRFLKSWDIYYGKHQKINIKKKDK